MVWENIINLGKISASGIKNKLVSWFSDKTPGEKRRLAVYCTAGFSFFLTAAVLLSIITTGREKKTYEPERIYINVPIPENELFLPDEPDFIPGVILDREKRSVWTEDDVMEFWQDPLREGEEPWRIKIENAIDELLERVP